MNEWAMHISLGHLVPPHTSQRGVSPLARTDISQSLNTHPHPHTHTHRHCTLLSCHNLRPCVDIPGGPVCAQDTAERLFLTLSAIHSVPSAKHMWGLWATTLAEACPERRIFVNVWTLHDIVFNQALNLKLEPTKETYGVNNFLAKCKRFLNTMHYSHLRFSQI